MTEPVVIGSARLYLGDCLEVLPHLPTTGAVITDPPYGIGYMAPTGVGGENKELPRRAYSAIKGDDAPFDPLPWLAFRPALFWGANHFADRLPASAAWLVWDKRDGMTSNNNSDFEVAWLSDGGSARMFRYLWNGMCQAGEKGRERVHPTQKPEALMAWCIERAGRPSLVIDPYMGSGTTGVAAVQMGCDFIGIESDPAYFEIACGRIRGALHQSNLFPAEALGQMEQESLL